MKRIFNKTFFLVFMGAFFLSPLASAMKKSEDPSSEEKRKLSRSSPKAKGHKLKNKEGENIRKKKTSSPALWWLLETRKGTPSRLHNRKRNSYTMPGHRPEAHEKKEEGGYIFTLPRKYKYDPKLKLWHIGKIDFPQSRLKPKGSIKVSPVISSKPEDDSKLEKMIKYVK